MAEIDDTLEYGSTSTNLLLSFALYNNNKDSNINIDMDDNNGIDEEDEEDMLQGISISLNQGIFPILAENAVLLPMLNFFLLFLETTWPL